MGVVPLLNPNWPWFVKKVEKRPLIPDSYAKRMVVSQIGSNWRHHARTTLLSDGESGPIPGERTSSSFHANQVIARIGGKHRSVLSPLREWNSNSFPAASELAVVHELDRARTAADDVLLALE